MKIEHDPIQDDPRIGEIFAETDAAVEQERQGVPPNLGICHIA
jgi:hypothetical protein